MQNYNRHIIQHAETADIDQGLRSYMLKVYSYMFMGLGITGAIAYAVTQFPGLQNFLFVMDAQGHVAASGATIALVVAQVLMVLFLSIRINKLDASTAQLLFWGYAALMGLTVSSLFLVYTGASLVRVFGITSATFGAMTLYGYTTKKDLSGFGSFLIMGLIGIMLASLVNLFLHSSMIEFVVSALGVLIFTGLTAYDTQRIKEIYWDQDGSEIQTKKAVMGALALYLDFINLFMMLLRFLGDRRN